MFKNEGRGLVKSDKIAEYEGKWQPVIGTYKPHYDSVYVNEADKLNKIDPEHDNSAKKKKLELHKRSTTLCQKFEKNLIKKSIFEAPEKRKIEVNKRKKELEEKMKEMNKVKVKAELERSIGNQFLKSLIKMAT